MANQDDRRSKDEARNAEREVRDAVRLESFALGGQNRLVKVIATPPGGRVPQTVGGFVTQERFLLGKTPAQIEEVLGVRVNSLMSGCMVLALQSVPGPSQIEYALTTNFPDGFAPSVLSDPDYPPFKKRYVHQWRLRVPMRVSFVRQLGPTDSYSSAP